MLKRASFSGVLAAIQTQCDRWLRAANDRLLETLLVEEREAGTGRADLFLHLLRRPFL
jgi:hypothetical protein